MPETIAIGYNGEENPLGAGKQQSQAAPLRLRDNALELLNNIYCHIINTQELMEVLNKKTMSKIGGFCHGHVKQRSA